jgi:hypothetical protein
MNTTNIGITSPKLEEDIYRTYALVVRALNDTVFPLADFLVVWDPEHLVGCDMERRYDSVVVLVGCH